MTEGFTVEKVKDTLGRTTMQISSLYAAGFIQINFGEESKNVPLADLRRTLGVSPLGFSSLNFDMKAFFKKAAEEYLQLRSRGGDKMDALRDALNRAASTSQSVTMEVNLPKDSKPQITVSETSSNIFGVTHLENNKNFKELA